LNGLISFSVSPLKFVTFLGVFWTGFGVLALLAVLVVLLCGAKAGLWAIAAFGALLAGNIMLCAGILGEYIGRIYNEARQRPLYFISDMPGFDINKEN
jgi:dolichol-phosphate mannosyltransferase